ncbi:unnamed protein product [Closterium sp. NIES-65]|nr:unnamed protein product [Closterium sp. NIES-65]
MRIGVALRSDGVATFGEGTKVGSSGRGNRDKGGKHGGSGSSSDTNSGRWGQGKGKAGVLDFPWGSKGMAPRGLCRGCWDEGHAWQRCPHRPKGGIPAFLKRGGRGSSGKAQVADEEEQDDKAEAVVGEAVAAVGEEQPRERWWIDSGASHNFTLYTSDFKSKLQPPEVQGVRLGDGRVVKAVGMGEVPVVGAGVRTPSVGGAVYVLSLIDDFTRRVCSFPLPNKESATVAKVLRQWHKDVELECGRKLKAIRSDRGGEFLGEAVKAWKVEFGTKTQLSVADIPQQNGVVERWHRTMAEGIRTLLVDSGLPARLWGEALMWVVWVKNRVTHSALPASITPMEAWSGQKPHVGMARIWGCMGSVMLHGHEKGGKLDARAVMCVCVWVDMESKAAHPSAAAQWHLGHSAEIRYTGYFLFLLLWSALCPSLWVPLRHQTSPPPVTGLQVLGIQSGTGGEEVGGDAGVVEGMLCLAREVEGVALAGVSTGDVPRTLVEALRGPEGPAWKAGAEKEVNAMRTMGVKEVLAQRYQMKDLGEVSMYLGVEVCRSVKDGWLEIGQEKYVRGLQGRFGDLLKETHRVHTPMSPNDLSKIRNGTWSTEEGAAADVKVY